MANVEIDQLPNTQVVRLLNGNWILAVDGSATFSNGGNVTFDAAGNVVINSLSVNSGNISLNSDGSASFGTGGFTISATGDITLPTANVTTLVLANPISFKGNLAVDDTSNGFAISGLNAGATIAQWEVVYLGAASKWLLADANGASTYPARGLAIAAYVDTNPAVILREGTVRNDAWNWTPGGTLYLSTTAGGLTQTPPAASGDKVQQVGFALTADIAYFNFASGEYLTVA